MITFSKNNRKQEGRKPSRSTFGKVFLALLSTAFVLGSAELMLRVAAFPPPRLLTSDAKNQYRMSPGHSFLYKGYLLGNYVDFTNKVSLNREGYHDRERNPIRSSPSTYRIMVLGDSYVENLSVPIERMFTSQLETHFNRDQPLGRREYEVIPIGHGHKSQKHQSEWLKERGPEYTPNSVLLVFFCGNDIMENSPSLDNTACQYAIWHQKTIYPRKIKLFNKLLLFKNSRVNGLLAETVVRFHMNHINKFDPQIHLSDLASPELGVYQTPPTPEWQQAFSITATYLDQIKATCASLNAPFMVASLSSPQAIGDTSSDRLWNDKSPGINMHQPEQWIQNWCLTNQIPFINLGPALDHAGRKRVFWRHDGHLNAIGNDVVAQALYPFFIEHIGR